MPFLATQIVNGLQKSFISPNSNSMSIDDLRIKLLDRSINTYLLVIGKLKEIRYGNDLKQCVYDMAKAITSKEL